MYNISNFATFEVLAIFVPINVFSEEHRENLLVHTAVVELEVGQSFDASTADADYTYHLCNSAFKLIENERSSKL